MLTNWRDQADFIIWNVWYSPVLTVIARRVLGEVSLVPNEGRHRTYDFDTGDKVMIIKYSAVLLPTGVYKSKVSRV